MKMSFIPWPFCLDPSHPSVGHSYPKLGRRSIQAESQQQDFPKTIRELHYDKDSQQGCPRADCEMHGMYHQPYSCFHGSFAPSKQHVTAIQTGAAPPPGESVSTAEREMCPVPVHFRFLLIIQEDVHSKQLILLKMVLWSLAHAPAC